MSRIWLAQQKEQRARKRDERCVTNSGNLSLYLHLKLMLLLLLLLVLAVEDSKKPRKPISIFILWATQRTEDKTNE